MENYDNEQRLRILQERLGQIKNKKVTKHDEQVKVENNPPYPTYKASNTKIGRGAKFEVYIDVKGEYRFRLKASNGEIIAVSEGYTAKHNCLNGIQSVKENASIAIIEEVENVKESLSRPSNPKAIESSREDIKQEYPTYNPKATESSDEDIIAKTEKRETSFSFPWKKFFILLIVGGVAYGAFYLYKNSDSESLNPEKTLSKPIIVEEPPFPLQYSLDFGDAKHLILIGDFENEEEAKSLVEQKKIEGYTTDFFFLPSVSNSKEQIYKVYIGPFLSESEAKQWKGTLEGEAKILSL